MNMPQQKTQKQVDRQNQQQKESTPTNEQTVYQDVLAGMPDKLPGSITKPSVHMQATRINDTRFLTAQRQAMALQIGRIAGNQYLQSVITSSEGSLARRKINDTGTEQVQRGLWDSITGWFSGLFSPDPKDVVRDLDSGLKHAHNVIEVIRTIDPHKRKKLEGLAERLKGLQRVTGGIVQVLNTAKKIEKAKKLIEALNDIPDDISSDPIGAADAFGQVFAAAGEFGQELPKGPWTSYCEWLSQTRHFFTDILHALDPGQRWQQQFEEIEREGAYTGESGIHH